MLQVEFIDKAKASEKTDANLPNDIVNRPRHYNMGKIEVIEFLEDQGLDFHLANAVKYICRAGHKDRDSMVQDLDKAIWYLNRRRELSSALKENRTPRWADETSKAGQ